MPRGGETLLLAQLAAAYVIGREALLTNAHFSPIPPIAITVFTPVALFLSAYGISPWFRQFVLAQDLRRLTMMQHWRVIGFAFLALYSFDVLPGLFAWPAGLGDVAVGLAALGAVARIDRDPDYWQSSRFLGFHLLGLLGFAVAVGAAGLLAGALPTGVARFCPRPRHHPHRRSASVT